MWMVGFYATSRSSPITFICAGLLVLQFVACSAINPVVSHSLIEIQVEDRNDLRSGNLFAIRERYERRGSTRLSEKELALLCDIYIKHMLVENALTCLDSLQARIPDNLILPRVTGKRALIAYLLGQYQHAASLSKDLQGNGGKYVHALAQVRLGNDRFAQDIAERWGLAFNPQQAYLAANLYLAQGRYDSVLKVLQYPEPGLARHYSLTGTGNVFGQQIKPAPLKLDLFDEFGFGLLDTYSYAPAANIYVEYLLAKSLLETGEQDNARARFDTILAYPHIGAYREVLWRALHERARIANMHGNTLKAIDLNQEAIKIIEGIRASISTEAGRIGFVGNKQSVYSDLIRILLMHGDVTTAFEYSERARSRALVDVLATQRKFGAREQLEVNIDELIHDYQRAENRILEIQGNPASTEFQAVTRSLYAERQRLLSLAPLLSGLMTVDPEQSKLENISANLVSNETMLSYFKAAEKWYVFVITGKGKTVHKQLDLTNLEQEIRDFRHALASGVGGSYEAQGRRLYDRLIRPVEGRLTKILTIVPYGELHYLPFAALHSDHGFLLQKHTLRMLPSAEVVTILGSSEKPKGSLLAFGNPARSDAVTLPFAEKEAQQVTQIYQPSELLLGTDATLTNFNQMARQHDILHIAAHGEFNKIDPLQSRLLLAPSRGDTGDLTATKLYSMEPSLNINIAVLSACETALSDITTGDELIGLQRGFLYAGADSLIGSLWRISDQTTVYLMERFYEALNVGASRAEALRHAQNMTLEHYPNTGTWAAFTYTGSLQ